MSQTGYTPIQLYRSTTPAAAPVTGNLSPGELAINISDTDMAIYAENASGTVTRIINNPAGLKYPTADGSSGQAVVTDGSGNLTFGSAGSALQAVASGTLSNGSTIIVNSDGTVSAVASETVVVSGSIGSPVTFNGTNSADNIDCCYDSTSGKVVVVYRDNNGTSYGTAIVGTISGTTISFGSEVVFNYANNLYISCCSVGSSKVVISYRDVGNSNYGTAIVGTISGTSITFGSEVVFNSDATSMISSCYDSGNGKVVIAYRDENGSNYGKGIVGTVSGTSISFGSETTFNSGNTYYTSCCYDSANGKVVIAYMDASNSDKGTAVVGTVSGTDISFGSEYVFNDATTNSLDCCYDSTNGKVVIAYLNGGNSNYGTAIVGTVSSTTISFGTAAVFKSSRSIDISCCYDSTSGKVLVVFRDVSNSYYGTSVTGTVSGTSISFGTPEVYKSSSTDGNVCCDTTSGKVLIAYADGGNAYYGKTQIQQIGYSYTTTNLTAENYIGISNAAYTDGQTATVQLIGAVDDAQSGLTAGQSYYVQGNGTISQTPATPSVFAGTAVSATKIIVKG